MYKIQQLKANPFAKLLYWLWKAVNLVTENMYHSSWIHELIRIDGERMEWCIEWVKLSEMGSLSEREKSNSNVVIFRSDFIQISLELISALRHPKPSKRILLKEIHAQLSKNERSNKYLPRFKYT